MEDQKDTTQEVVTEDVNTESVVDETETEQEEEVIEAPESNTEVEEVVETTTDTEVEDENKEDDGSLKETPFNKNPEFKKRLDDIENKYGGKARNWDAFMASIQGNPDMQLQTVKILEDSGQVPKGTYDMAIKKLGVSKKNKKDTKPVDDDVVEKINALPEVQYARELYEDNQKKKQQEEAEKLATLQAFEDKHQDVVNKPGEVKATIATVATFLQSKDSKLSLADALDQAYQTLFKQEDVINEAREKGKVEGQINAATRNVIATPSTTSSAGRQGIRKLTPEEEAGRQSLGGDSTGWTREEYIKFKDEY